MQSGFQAREVLFRELAQMLSSGVPLARALDVCGRHARPATAVARALEAGAEPGEAFGRAGFPPADVAAISAGAASGRLETVFGDLSTRYRHLGLARRRILSRSAYPVLVIHLAAVLLSIPPAILEGSPGGFISRAALVLGVFYAICVGGAIAVRLASRAFAEGGVLGATAAAIPGLGSWLVAWTSARFASVFSILVRSGLGPLKALDVAGACSGNATLRHAAIRAAALVRQGASLEDGFAGVPPPEIERAMRVGGQTGHLDDETARAADILEARALGWLETFAEWLPRLLYLAVAIFVGWRIVVMALEVGGAVGNALDPP